MLVSLNTSRRSQAIASLSCSFLPFYFCYVKPLTIPAAGPLRIQHLCFPRPFDTLLPSEKSCPDTKGWFIVSWEHRGTDTKCMLLQAFQIWFILQKICWWSAVIVFLLGWFGFCWGFFSECLFHKWCNKPFKNLDKIFLSLLQDTHLTLWLWCPNWDFWYNSSFASWSPFIWDFHIAYDLCLGS